MLVPEPTGSPTSRNPLFLTESVPVFNRVHDLLEFQTRTVALQPGSLRVVPTGGGRAYIYRVISLDSVAGTVKFDHVMARNGDEVSIIMALPGEGEGEDVIENFLKMTRH